MIVNDSLMYNNNNIGFPSSLDFTNNRDKNLIRDRRNKHAIKSILNTMFSDEVDHCYSDWKPAYCRYRLAVCEWIMDVCRYFKLDISTTHKAIVYLDRLQPDETFSKDEWQMIAITCILVAAKFNEKEEHLPPLNLFEEITNQTIPNAQLLDYELWVLRKLGWQLNAFPPLSFITCYCTHGIVYRGDIIRNNISTSNDSNSNSNNNSNLSNVSGELSDNMMIYAYRAANKCILIPELKHVLASTQAAAIIYITRRRFDVQPWWRQELETMTSCDLTSVTSVVQMMDSFNIPASLEPKIHTTSTDKNSNNHERQQDNSIVSNSNHNSENNSNLDNNSSSNSNSSNSSNIGFNSNYNNSSDKIDANSSNNKSENNSNTITVNVDENENEEMVSFEQLEGAEKETPQPKASPTSVFDIDNDTALGGTVAVVGVVGTSSECNCDDLDDTEMKVEAE